MRRYASARVATLESSHFKSSLLFLFTNTSSGFVVVSVSRARGTHCTGGAHGAGARFPRERVRHSVRGALPFANSLIIGPIVPISICPGRSLLPSMRHWDTDPACPPSSPSSFSFRHSVHEELPGATSKCRRVHRPGGQRALLDPPRHDARVPGAHLVRPPRRDSVRFFYNISVWAIVLMTSCFV